MSKITLITAPTEEPVSIDELKDHCAETDAAFDLYIYELGVAARTYIETTLWRALCTQTWDQYFDRLDSPMRLRNPPLAATDPITHVKYTDAAGDQQTVATTVYEAGDVDGVGIVRLKYNQSWPSGARGHADDVVVRFIAGYGAATAVPGPIRHAIKLLVGDLYAHRENTITGSSVARLGTLEAMLRPYNVRHDV